MNSKADYPPSGFNPDRLLVPALVFGFIGAAVLVGLVTATGRPILIALVVGAILGVLLLNASTVAVWLVLVGTLLISGPLFMHMPQLLKVGWLFSLLGFFLLGVAMLQPALGRARQAGKLPGFIGLSIVFLTFAIGSTIVSEGSLNEGVTAIKRYFQFWGLMYLLAVFPFKAATIRQWIGFLGVVAVLHVPFAVYQRFVIVPAWEYMNGVRGFVALDIVVGTFEGTLGGGGSSSVMAYSSLLALAFVLCAYREKMLSPFKTMLALLVVMAPLALGETKVVVLWIPVVLLAINLDQVRKHPVGFVFSLMIAAVAMAAFVWVYLTLQATDGRTMTLEERLAETIAYNFGRAGYFGGSGLNRTTVLSYWWQHHGLQDPVAFMFGHGLGSSYGAGERVPITGHMHDAHRGQGIGLSATSAILWDLGLVGLLLYYSVFLGATRVAFKLVRNATPGFDRALCKTLLASILVLWTMPFYHDLILQTPSMEVLTALTFGLIAWRSRTAEFPAPAPDNPISRYQRSQYQSPWVAGDPVMANRRSDRPTGGRRMAVAHGATTDTQPRIEPSFRD